MSQAHQTEHTEIGFDLNSSKKNSCPESANSPKNLSFLATVTRVVFNNMALRLIDTPELNNSFIKCASYSD